MLHRKPVQPGVHTLLNERRTPAIAALVQRKQLGEWKQCRQLVGPTVPVPTEFTVPTGKITERRRRMPLVTSMLASRSRGNTASSIAEKEKPHLQFRHDVWRQSAKSKDPREVWH
jgi:hypothetical protein